MFLKIRKHLICVTAFVFLTLLCVICTMTFTQEKQTSFATEMEEDNFRLYDGSGVFNNGFDDIGSAWAAAKKLSFDKSSEVTVKMFADAEVTDTLNIDGWNYDIELDLNGHKLSMSESGKYIIQSIGKLTLSDSNPTATNSITSYARGSSPKTVEISGGVITGANAYAAVYISSGYFNMHGGNIAGNVINSVNGAAVKPGATFNMTGGAITENVNTADGIGGLHAQWTKFNVSGAVKIDGNTSCTSIDDNERAESNYGYDYNSSIVINGALNDGAGNKTRIGITLMSDYASRGTVISQNYKTHHAGEAANTYFYSDNYQKCPQFDYYKEVAFYNHSGFENYTNEGDKHSADCKKCGARVTSEHSYSSSTGKCACGAQAAASVGNSYYSELSQAWAAAKTAATATVKMFIDVTIAQVLGVLEEDTSNVTLDLNGHTVNGIAGSVSIQIEGGENTFTLKDSKGGGKLTGGAGGICIAKGATVNMESGEISGNSSEFGGGVYINGGTFNMRGGTIKENTAQTSGGGVYLNGGTFTVSGSVQISGNTVNSKANNVQAGGGTFTVSGELTETARIYVYMESAGDVATGYSQSVAPTSYFISDNEQLNCIYNDNGTVKFAAHDFESSTKYKSDERGHWKVCAHCTVEDENNKTAHSGGTATCISKARCEYCGGEYGNLGGHNIAPSADGVLCSLCSEKAVAAVAGYDGVIKYYLDFDIAWNSTVSLPYNQNKKVEFVLLADAEVKRTLSVKIRMVVFLNGYKIKLTSNNGSVISVQNNGYLLLENRPDTSTENQDIEALGAYDNTLSHTIKDPVGGSSVTLNGGLITGGNSYQGGGIYVGGSAYLSVGGFVYISDNRATNGGGVYVDSGTVHFDGAEASYNTAQTNGGGVYVKNAATFRTYACIIKNNSALLLGGGIYFEGENSDNDLSWCDINYNTAGTGGGIYVKNSNVRFSQTNIIYNTATSSGGGAYIDKDSSLKVESNEYIIASVRGNTANSKDNNVYLETGAKIDFGQKSDAQTEIYIYVTLAEGYSGVFTSNYSQHYSETPSKYLFSDVKGVCAQFSEGEALFAPHSFGDWTYANDREHESACACGEKNTERHSGGAATCTEKAVCSVCESGYGELEAHSYGNWETTLDPTCTATGSEKHTCIVCSHEETKEIAIDSDAHSWDDGVITTQPTCMATGVKTFTCAHNSEHTKTEDIAIDETAHSFGEWTESKPADCTHKGEETRVCAHNSAHKETRETEASGHSWNPEPLRVEPTCTADGSVTDTCTVCGETDTGVLLKLGHDIERCEAQAATCTEKGWSAYEICSRCDYTTYAETEALGHDFETEFTVDEAATCMKKGSQSKHCTRCDEKTETTEIPLAPHTMTHIGRVEATTAANGNIEYWSCSVCEKKFSDLNGTAEIDSVIIPKLKAELVYGGEREIVVTAPNGFAPDIELVVTEIENYAQYESIAQTVNGEINLAYDVTLKSNGATIQPDATLTIKLRIPENLQGKNFNLFHLYGSETTDMEYTVDGDFAVVNTDRLSQFIFVGEKAAPVATPEQGLSAGAIAGISVGVIIAVLLVAYVAMYFTLYRKGVLKGKAFGAIYAPMNAIFDKKKQS